MPPQNERPPPLRLIVLLTTVIVPQFAMPPSPWPLTVLYRTVSVAPGLLRTPPSDRSVSRMVLCSIVNVPLFSIPPPPPRWPLPVRVDRFTVRVPEAFTMPRPLLRQHGP